MFRSLFPGGIRRGPGGIGASVVPLTASVVALTALLLVGCDSGARGGLDSVVVEDSAGVRIVTSPPPPPASPTAAWRVDPEPRVVIGVVEGEEAYQLSRVVSALRLSTGTIVIANAGSSELRWFDADGRHLRSAGRSGAGPGEFRLLQFAIPLPDESVAAFDASNSRVTAFGLDGGLLWSWVPVSEGRFPPPPRFAFADGRYLAWTESTPSQFNEGYTHFRGEQTLLLYPDRESPVREILRLPGRDALLYSDGGFVMNLHVPFGRASAVAVSGDRILQGNGDAWEVRGYDIDGELRDILRVDLETDPVTPDAVRADREALLARVPTPEAQATVAERYENARIPDRMPAWRDLLMDDGGYLWVHRYAPPGDDAERWIVLAPDGAALAEVAFPAGLRVRQIGSDFVLGTATDELGVEQVHLHRLVRP